mgnify:CR=1 FL=1
MIDTFWWKMTILLGLAAIAYLLVALAPLILPAIRAFRRTRRLERPSLFTGTVAALTYGGAYWVAAVMAIPVQAYVVFVAPVLHEAGKDHGAWLSSGASFIGTWWWPVLPLAVLVAALLLTRKLAAKWAGICSALA